MNVQLVPIGHRISNDVSCLVLESGIPLFTVSSSTHIRKDEHVKGGYTSLTFALASEVMSTGNVHTIGSRGRVVGLVATRSLTLELWKDHSGLHG